MQYPIEVILQRTADTPDVEAAVFEAVGQLEQFCDHILGCQVFIRGPEASDDGATGQQATGTGTSTVDRR